MRSDDHTRERAFLDHARGSDVTSAVTPAAAVCCLQRRYVDRLRSLVAGLGVEGDTRALVEGLEAARVDPRVVDEEVLALVVRRDEAEALVGVEPLHGS